VRLLILDEDARLRERLAAILRGRGDEVALAASTSDALGQLEADRFDLVFTELVGTRTDGLAFLREVGQRWPATRVVVITAAATVGSAVKAMRAGAFDFVPKPFKPARVRELVDRVRKAPSELPPGPTRELLLGLPAPLAEEAAGHVLGEGRLERGGAEPTAGEGRVQKVLRIDATGASPNLLARLLIGSYMTGQDQVLVTAHAGLSPTQREEVHHVADRILGMSVVGEGPTVVEVQIFVDPARYPLPRLLQRVVRMLRGQLATCRAALAGTEPSPLAQLDSVEDEVDRLYLLMVRQLVLSSESPRLAKSIEVESHHHQICYRLVAKILEVAGDLIHESGVEIARHLAALRRLPAPTRRELEQLVARLDGLLARTMDAFGRLSAVDANAVLNEIGRRLPRDSALGDRLARRTSERKVGLAAQRIVGNLVMMMEMLVIIDELAINHSVEPQTLDRGALPAANRPA
jgi:DNA-binding response OmpR family regulator/phosphate uptake regulator